MSKYLFVWYVNELEEQYESNEHRLTVDKTKAGVEVTLVHEEAKQEQREEEVELKETSPLSMFC